MREDLVATRRERARLEAFAVRQEKGARSEFRVALHTGHSHGAAGLLAERWGPRGAPVVCPASVECQWEREVRRGTQGG